MGGKTNRLLYVKPCELSMGEVGPEHMCAGAQAIMPAHKLGAGKMVLLGFDNKPGHWATSRSSRSISCCSGLTWP